MKHFLLILIVLFTFSCKEKEDEVVPRGDVLIGTFVIPTNEDISFTMTSEDSFAVVHVNHQGKKFTFKNATKGAELNLIITEKGYYVRLKTFYKGNDTHVSYLLGDVKSGNIIFSYTGIVKRTK